MTAILEQLAIHRMTIVEWIALAQEILDTVAAEQPRPALSEAKQQELDRRLAAHETDPTAIIAWEDIEAAALQRFA